MKPNTRDWYSLFILLGLVMILGLFPGNYAMAQAPQTPAPDCLFFISQTFTGASAATVSYPTNTGTGVVGFDNRQLGCQTYTFQYTATPTSGTLTGLSFQSAVGASTPGSYADWAGTVSLGINPATTNSGNSITTYSTGCTNGMACTVANSWVKILFTRGNFVGHIQGVLYGYRTGYARSGGGGSTGTVTEVDTGCGLSGGPITTTGTIAVSMVENPQNDTYTLVNGDCGKILTFNNTVKKTWTIPQAGSGGNFISGWSVHIENRGSGQLTLSPTTSTIDGSATIVLSADQGILLTSNGTDYRSERGRGYNLVTDSINGTLPVRNVIHCVAPVSCSDLASTNNGETDITATVSGQLHSITFNINGGGSAITTGDLNIFPTADYACTISRIDTSGNPSGSITVDIWKAAGAIPTSGNKISASAPATLSSSQLNQNGSLTGWTLGVSIGDVFGATVATVATVTSVMVQIWCQ